MSSLRGIIVIVEIVFEDWTRVLVIVVYFDDFEYGVVSAVVRWIG